MTFKQKIQTLDFWSKFIKIFFPFFLFLTVISLFLNSWRDVFAGNFELVYQLNFADGKWILFFGYKIVLTFLYSLWVTNKNYKN